MATALFADVEDIIDGKLLSVVFRADAAARLYHSNGIKPKIINCNK